jgi:4-amino-4-deoxy-L-arabinose transferase-like glycosyltransferase
LSVPLVLASSSPSGRGAETLLDYRQPLWPLLVAPAAWLAGDGYDGARALSLATGIALLWLIHAVGVQLFGRIEARIAVVCCAYSYLLVDYSGNGSLYQLHALLLLAFIAAVGRVNRLPFAILVGGIMGAAFLLHGSGVVLTLAFAIIQGLAWSWGKLRQPVREVVLPMGMAALVALPWLVRNLVLFGDLLPSGSDYLYFKLGMPWTVSLVGGQPLVRFAGTGLSMENLGAISHWTALNAYYSLRQVLVLAPVFALTAPIGVYLVGKRVLATRQPSDLALLVVPTLFCLLTFVWPVVKFRTFVVLVPMAFLLGVHGAVHGLPRTWGRVTVRVGVAAVLLSSVLTFAGTESHTYYYDGVLTRDNFGKAGEAEYVAEQRALQRLGDELARRGHAPILTEQLNLHYYTRYPVVQLVAEMDDTSLRRLRQAHAADYVVTRREQMGRYQTLFGGQPIAGDGPFAALELEPVRARPQSVGGAPIS